MSFFPPLKMSKTLMELQNGDKIEASTSRTTPDSMIIDFLLQNEPAFAKLVEIRKKGWSNPSGDVYFQNQRHAADKADRKAALRFFDMMKQIGDELQQSTGAIGQASSSTKCIKVLDLCMAPGGYTSSALKYNPRATAFGISLPRTQGGHEVLFRSPQLTVKFLDITMLTKEFGVEEPAATHPEYAKFSNDRPFLEHKFELVFCDGQVLRQHKRHESREKHERLRLNVSQLILAIQRIRDGGTLIMLLHKLELWETVALVHQVSFFSSIRLFKPQKKHAIRSSFYLVAENVRPDSKASREAIEGWKSAWQKATFGEVEKLPEATNSDVKSVLDTFGSELVELGRPIWEIQAEALSKMEFTK